MVSQIQELYVFILSHFSQDYDSPHVPRFDITQVVCLIHGFFQVVLLLTENFLDDTLSGHLALFAMQLISDVTPNRVIILYFRPTVGMRSEQRLPTEHQGQRDEEEEGRRGMEREGREEWGEEREGREEREREDREEGIEERERAIVSCGGLLGMVNERLQYDMDEAMTDRQTDRIWRDIQRQIIQQCDHVPTCSHKC